MKSSSRSAKRIPDSKVKEISYTLERMRDEIGKVFFGQEKVVDSLIRALLCDGHVLLEGVPGIAKTLAIKALAQVSGCTHKRIQFTVDLLPSDIIGLTTYDSHKGFSIVKGPIFANFIIADEINRTTPKCVLGDTPVITNNGEILDIKAIIDKYSSKKVYRDGSECWIEPNKSLELPAFDHKSGKIKPERVKYLYKQKTSAPYHKVILKSGREIKTSPVHPFFTLRNGKIETVNANELEIEDCVLVPKRLSFLGNNKLEYDEEFLKRSREIYKEISLRKELYNKIKEYKERGFGYVKIKSLLGVKKEEEDILKTFMQLRPRYLDYTEDYFFTEAKQFGQVRGVRMPLEITKEFAHFMAILIAEGSVNKSYFYVSMKDRNILEYFVRIVKDVFGLNINLLYDDEREIYRVAFRSDALIDLLKAIGCNPHLKAGEKYIPSFILRADDEIVREFLSVYYECDGCVSRGCIKVTTKSKKIANALSYLLLRVGFVAKINRDLSTTKIGGYSYRRKFYNLLLYGGEFSDFYNKINFFSDGKKMKLYSLIKNINRKNTDLIPEMHMLIRNLRKSANMTHKEFYTLTGMHAHNLENPNNALMLSRYRLANVIKAFQHERTLTNLINGDFYCDFIKENEVIQPKKEYWLYDFSMENTHSFIAGFGGIISHNTQSALIEAMQEKQVTIGTKTYPLPMPFFVMANQNPIENEGVYSLPEAQIDRFLFKIIFGYPDEKDEARIMEENITFKQFEDFKLKPIVNSHKIINMQKLTHQIYLDQRIKNYILNIVKKTRSKDFLYGEYIDLGASPRASIALFIASKAEALMKGRNYVIPYDVKEVAHDILRHRLILSYKARADGVTTDKIIDEVFKVVNVP